MLMLVMTVLATLLPTVVLLRWFRNSDRFPEPWPVVRKVFWLGVAIVIPILILGKLLKPFLPTELVDLAFYKAFVIAAFSEELFKYLVLVLYCLKLPDFDEPIDGIVYGVTVSLGFATFENILYVMNGGFSVAVMRAFTSVPAHALMGTVMGYFIAMTLLDHGQKIKNFSLALIVPILIHGLYDFPLMYISEAKLREVETHTGSMFLLWIVVLMLSWWVALKYKKQLVHNQLRTTE